MNVVDRYINSSIWFHVSKVTTCKRQQIEDPFKLFKQNKHENSVSVEFDCRKVSKEMLAYSLKPSYRKLYFKFNIEGKNYMILIFNASATYSFYKDNIFTVEFTAEDVIINNVEVEHEYCRTLQSAN